MPDTERRQTKRLPFSCPVSIMTFADAKGPANEFFARGEVINISSGGMHIRIKNHVIKKGTALRIMIPILSDFQVTVPVLSEARWTRKDSPDSFRIGVRFLI
jgi:hypothetical protein